MSSLSWCVLLEALLYEGSGPVIAHHNNSWCGNVVPHPAHGLPIKDLTCLLELAYGSSLVNTLATPVSFENRVNPKSPF